MSFKNIKKAIQSLSEEKKEIAEALLDKVEFMEAELDKLQTILKKKGWTEAYQNGANQSGMKKSSEAEVYNNLIKNYNATLKAILDMLPEGGTDEPGDEFFR